MNTSPAPPLRHRPATRADCALLAEWNHQLIHDEGHDNPMTVPELEERMRGWLRDGCEAVIFEQAGLPVAYALYIEAADRVHLRHCFVARDRRRKGIGTAAIAILRERVWPHNKRLTVDVLARNAPGVAFWRATGYADYCLTLDIKPAAIRLATPADGPEVLKLLTDCLAAMRAAGIEQWDEVYPNVGVIENDIAAGALHIHTEAGRITACITIDTTLDPLWQSLDWSPHGTPAGAVHRLMVHPSRQGRGLAKMLMLHAEAVARQKGCRSLRLDSFVKNPAAIALYPRLGYRRTGTAQMRKGAFAGFEKLLFIRALEQEDLPAATELWRSTEGVGLAPDETPEMLAAYLRRNPGISSVTVDEHGALTGAVLGGHDGRRGYLCHLAVSPAHRGKGLGRLLVDRATGELARAGIARAAIMVYKQNPEGQAFWRHLGWSVRDTLETMGATLKPIHEPPSHRPLDQQRP